MGRGRHVLVLALLVALVGLPQGTVASPPAMHAAVAINSNADFTAANGVIGGSGSIADPYVIADWHFTSSFGTALIIQGTTAAFVVRDNIFEGYNGLLLVNNSAPAVVLHNQFLVRNQGMSVTTSHVEVRANAYMRVQTGAQGIWISSSLIVVANNSFAGILRAIIVNDGNATIDGNDIHDGDVGIYVRASYETCVTGNVITDTRQGIFFDVTIKGCVSGNVIVSGDVGMTLFHCKDLNVANNTIRGEAKVGALFETCTGNFTGNLVIDGRIDGLQVWRGPVLTANNTISNNLHIGAWFSYAVSTAENNTITLNGVGILVESYSVVDLTANVLANNTVGIDLRYDSRQTIPHMSANLVNGVNVDGTLVASEKVFFYHAANVTIQGGVRDSGFSAGYYGSLTAQGNVVLWEVDNARVNATVISHSQIGVGVYDSFNVVVSNASILQTGIGVYAQGSVCVSGSYYGCNTPPCVVSVKDTNITIPVDPIGTFGIDAHICVMNVLRVNISVADTGVRFDGLSSGDIVGNTIFNTKLGLDIASKYYIDVEANVLAGNVVGARFTSTSAYFEDNHVFANLGAGVELSGGSRIIFEDNVIEANGAGVIDVRACSGSPALTCSTIEAEGDLIAHNRGEGLRINGSARLENVVLLGNRGNGATLASATLLNVTAEGNGGDGVKLTGVATIRGSQFRANGVHGLELRGSGDVRRSNFTFNTQAGLRVSPTNVQVLDANISFNFDGVLLDGDAPTSSVLSLNVGLTTILQLSPVVGPPAPLDLHRSILLGNERDSIRAGTTAVNATNNWFGGGAPALEVADTVGTFHNGVTPTVRFVPWFEDQAMTTTGPVPLL